MFCMRESVVRCIYVHIDNVKNMDLIKRRKVFVYIST
jgi:hypothetical protein